MGMEEIEKQFGVTSTSEFEDQISERKREILPSKASQKNTKTLR